MDRRNPHQTFDVSRISSFLGSRKIISQKLMTSGKSNTNYMLVLSDQKKYLLRLFSQGSAEREVTIMNLVRHLVPVPEEIERGDGWSVFTFLEGDLLCDVPEYSGKAAAAIADISSITFDKKGWITADGNIEAFPFESKGFVNEMLERDDIIDWIGQPRASGLKEVMQRMSKINEEMNRDACLVHGDFNPTNILIKEGTVSGILDWEYSHSGTPFMDIGNLLRNTDEFYHDQIAQGLASSGINLPDNWKDRARLIDISSQLEFLTSSRSDTFKQECVGRIDRFLNHFGPGNDNA